MIMNTTFGQKIARKISRHCRLTTEEMKKIVYQIYDQDNDDIVLLQTVYDGEIISESTKETKDNVHCVFKIGEQLYQLDWGEGQDYDEDEFPSQPYKVDRQLIVEG